MALSGSTTAHQSFRAFVAAFFIALLIFICSDNSIIGDDFTHWHTFRFQVPQNGALCYGEKKEMCMYGQIHTDRKYAVYAGTLFTANATSFAFDLPLSALAWKRIGFNSMVIVIGDPRTCSSQTRIQHIFSALLELEYVVIIVLDIPKRHAMTFNLIGRMFGSSIVPPHVQADPAWQDTYLVTADADVWPIDYYRFDLPKNKDIIHGSVGDINFLLHNQNIIHVPASYIGMRVRTWIEVNTIRGNLSLPTTPAEMLKYYAAEFGEKKAYMEVHRPSFDTGWFMDQFLLSKRLAQWKGRNGEFSHRVAHDKLNYTGDRIDKSFFWVWDINDKLDAHLMSYLYKEDVWNKTWPLVKLLYNQSTAQRCLDYKNTFLALKEEC